MFAQLIGFRVVCIVLKTPPAFFVKVFFSTNNENHNLDTRQRNNLYLPQANLTIYQKAAYYSGIKIFNNLPLEIKNLAGDQKKFKITLKKILYLFILHYGRVP
jgi:hypothetical protein